MSESKELKPLDFGDYCSVEQKRYGAENEHYCFKVIGRLNSNTYTRVPVDANDDKRIHEKVVPVLDCVNAAVGSERMRFRECDVKPWNTRAESPDSEKEVCEWADCHNVCHDPETQGCNDGEYWYCSQYCLHKANAGYTQSPPPPAAGGELITSLQRLAESWQQEGNFLRGPNDCELDHAVGRAYLNCRDQLLAALQSSRGGVVASRRFVEVAVSAMESENHGQYDYSIEEGKKLLEDSRNG